MPLDRQQGRLGVNRWEHNRLGVLSKMDRGSTIRDGGFLGDAWRDAIDGGARTSRRGPCDIRMNFLQSYAEENGIANGFVKKKGKRDVPGGFLERG